jgi:adenosylcobinamide-phosphate synthase
LLRHARNRPIALGLAAGWAVDELIGDPIRYHPVAGFGRAAEKLERVMWHPSRAAGIAYVFALVMSVTSATRLLDNAVRRVGKARFAMMAVVCWTVLGGRSLRREARNLASSLERGDVEDARRVARALVGRNPTDLDRTELCRAAVESVAENTADAIVGPIVWGAIAGPAGAAGYRAVNTLDAMVGYRGERYERFGWAAARLDDLVTWPAARLAAVLSTLLAPVVGGDARRAWNVWRANGNSHPSPNAGQLEAAFAGALGVTLGGRNHYAERVEDRPLIGRGPRPELKHVQMATRLSQVVGATALILCFLVASRNPS